MEQKNRFRKGALCGALAMLLVVGIVGGTLMIFAMLRYDDKAVNMETQQKLEAIRSLIQDEYLYGDEIEESELQDQLIKGYVSGLGDPYSQYYNEEKTRELFETTTGEFGGIGVVISQDLETQIMSFVNIYEDSPGEKAGFQAGDMLYKVNGEDVTMQALDTVVSKIRGEVGTKVEITVLRGDAMEEYTGTATRAIIEADTVNHEMKENQIGYIRVSGFELVTYEQFEEALTELTTEGMQGLVIDLRSNPGGNLSTVCEMLDLILPEGKIVSIEDKYGKGETYTSDAEHQLNVPLVVLIDGNSASASEIFAGAVQDYDIGTLVGTTTFGKGIVQQIYQMTDGTSLKITTSEYFTPNGRNIHGVGIEPDVEIQYVYDAENPEADNQLEKALEIIKSGM